MLVRALNILTIRKSVRTWKTETNQSWYVYWIQLIIKPLLTSVRVIQLPIVASSHPLVHLHMHICPRYMASIARQK